MGSSNGQEVAPYAGLDDSLKVQLEISVSRPDGQAVSVTLAIDPELYVDLPTLERFRGTLSAIDAVLLWACGDERFRLTAEGLLLLEVAEAQEAAEDGREPAAPAPSSP